MHGWYKCSSLINTEFTTNCKKCNYYLQSLRHFRQNNSLKPLYTSLNPINSQNSCNNQHLENRNVRSYPRCMVKSVKLLNRKTSLNRKIWIQSAEVFLNIVQKWIYSTEQDTNLQDLLWILKLEVINISHTITWLSQAQTVLWFPHFPSPHLEQF
jgi:hypothetical protein